MINILIFIVIVAVVFFTRKIWSNAIVAMLKKRKNSLVVSNTQASGSVFSPSGTVRTFNISIDLQEMGDGTARITLAKLKDKEV